MQVHFYIDSDPEAAEQIKQQFSSAVNIIDVIYPKITVNLLLVHGEFCPASLDRLSYETGIDKNRMFLACPNIIKDFSDFGGIRIITH